MRSYSTGRHPNQTDRSMHRVRTWARTKAHGRSPLTPESRARPSLGTPHVSSVNLNRQQSAVSGPAPAPAPDAGPTNVQPGSEKSQPGAAAAAGDAAPGKPVTVRFFLVVKDILLSSWLNLLLIFVPVGIAVHFAGLPPAVIFSVNAIAIIPLAGLLSFATESVAIRLGDAWAALLNVTFGNAVELIIFIIALVKNEIRIVQASLIGSILANLLLILGMCFLLGGLRFREQIYNSTVTQTSACLMSLSVISLFLPTAFHASFNNEALANARVIKVSRGTSVILLLVYVLYLLFQLISHKYMYESTPQHIIEAETFPGPAAAYWDSSSSSSSSSSSDSSSSSSSDESTGTARRIGRMIRRRRNRKSSNAATLEVAANAFSSKPISPRTSTPGAENALLVVAPADVKGEDAAPVAAAAATNEKAVGDSDPAAENADAADRDTEKAADEDPDGLRRRKKYHKHHRKSRRKSKKTKPQSATAEDSNDKDDGKNNDDPEGAHQQPATTTVGDLATVADPACLAGGATAPSVRRVDFGSVDYVSLEGQQAPRTRPNPFAFLLPPIPAVFSSPPPSDETRSLYNTTSHVLPSGPQQQQQQQQQQPRSSRHSHHELRRAKSMGAVQGRPVALARHVGPGAVPAIMPIVISTLPKLAKPTAVGAPGGKNSGGGAGGGGGGGGGGGVGGGDGDAAGGGVDGEHEEPQTSRTTAVLLLLTVTALVALCAEFMVGSIEGIVNSSDEGSGVSETFVGLILLPIVGNAAEHVTAVTVAMKNKMDLALGVALGSSIQIAIFITPLVVLLGWMMDKDMSLYFTLFETVSLFASAFIVNFLVLDGRSNYLEGALLCATYIIIAIIAFFYPNDSDANSLGGGNDNSAVLGQRGLDLATAAAGGGAAGMVITDELVERLLARLVEAGVNLTALAAEAS